jgi:hypothetical protein
VIAGKSKITLKIFLKKVGDFNDRNSFFDVSFGSFAKTKMSEEEEEEK